MIFPSTFPGPGKVILFSTLCIVFKEKEVEGEEIKGAISWQNCYVDSN